MTLMIDHEKTISLEKSKDSWQLHAVGYLGWDPGTEKKYIRQQLRKFEAQILDNMNVSILVP